MLWCGWCVFMGVPLASKVSGLSAAASRVDLAWSNFLNRHRVPKLVCLRSVPLHEKPS